MKIIELLKYLLSERIHYRLNIFRSLSFSVKAFKKKGFCFPILVYGRIQYWNKGGIIFLDKDVYTGLYSIGKGNNLLSSKYDMIRFNNNGRICLKGPLRVLPGAKAFIRPGGRLTIMGGHIGANFKLQCTENIYIGKNVLLSWDVQVMDSDMHYMVEGNTIRRNSKRIEIGENAWISNRVSVLKGTKLPPNIIVASNSLLSKDYSSIPENSVLAGTPAHCVKENVQRVQGVDNERLLREYFRKNKSENSVNAEFIGIKTQA